MERGIKDGTNIAYRKLNDKFGGQTAVDNVNFEMPEKHFKSIIGPNGAGKTTFFNLISGELKPTSGDVFFVGNHWLENPQLLVLGKDLDGHFK